MSLRLGDLGRREEALAASAEATGIYRELAARWPDVYHHELEQPSQVAPGLRTAKTSATHFCGNLRRDNGPLSRVPVAALLAALPDAIMYSHRYACTWVGAAQGDSEGPTFISQARSWLRDDPIADPHGTVAGR